MTARTRLILIACTALTFASGCATGPQLRDPMRAIWVTRFDYRTQDDVERIVENCADAGFNTILFQVRGNGTVFYRSNLEPWAEQFDFKDPGYDPLDTAIRVARARDVQLHAWVNVLPAWRGEKPPTNPDQLYFTHPEWFWYDREGRRQGLNSFYVSLNPCLPEVRDYLVNVFREIVANYSVDGLHLDYIRFPNEPPATPRGSGIDYPYDETTLTLYRNDTGLAPSEDVQRWKDWRTEQVTTLVGEIQGMLNAQRRPVPLTASVGSIRKNGLSHYQDGEAWLSRGLLDAVILMDYVDDPEEFSRRIDPWLAVDTPARVVPGLWFGRHTGATREAAIAAVAEQIRIARERTGDFCVFSYGALFDSADDGELSRPTEAQRTLRAARREALIPVIQGADEAGG